MARYFITGATGFLGRGLLDRLLARPGTEAVHVLVRAGSPAPVDPRATPVVGDLREPGLGLDLIPPVDHVVHLAAITDPAAPDADVRAVNVDGTAHALDYAAAVGARLFHHVSSTAVAGDHRGRFTEADFDLGQRHHHPLHAAAFAAEALVRAQDRVPFRVYRPATVVGDSRTGAADRVSGPLHLLPLVARLARLPRALPLVLPDLGTANLVPVDYVADALAHLVHVDAPPGATFHLAQRGGLPATEVYAAFAAALGAPRLAATVPLRLPRPSALPRPGPALAAALAELGVPAGVVAHADLPARVDTTATEAALAGAATPPPFAAYAARLVEHWAEHLDPDRPHRRGLAGRRVAVTGASSGIGAATALALGERGAHVLLVARRADELAAVAARITAAGGAAEVHPCDLTDADAVDALVKDLGAVDMLVNNAGRSIRRSVHLSVDRMHDFERTMALNYFAPLRLTLGLLPGMRERGFGRVVTVTTMGLQSDTPRFAAYLASKGAVEHFGRAAGRELLADGVTFCSVRMPLVRTPMIGATDAYRGVPAFSPDTAARMVLDALSGTAEVVQRPEGRALELVRALAPALHRQALNLVHRLTPESAPEARAAAEHPGAVLASALVRPLWRALRRPGR